MPGTTDPFTPGPTDDPTANLPDYDTFGKIKDQWNTFLDQPGGRAALLSAGLSLMQPPSFGDTPTAQIGRAIGAGGEALSRQEVMDTKLREAASKEDLRTAQANTAAANAGTAEARAATAAGRLQVQQEQLEHAKRVSAFQEEIKARIAYGRAVDAIHRRNEMIRKQNDQNKLLYGPKATITPEIPVPSAEEWISKNSGLGAGIRMEAPATPAVQSPAQSGYDVAPKNPADREVGKKYIGTGGRVGTWTPDGWIPDN